MKKLLKEWKEFVNEVDRERLEKLAQMDDDEVVQEEYEEYPELRSPVLRAGAEDEIRKDVQLLQALEDWGENFLDKSLTDNLYNTLKNRNYFIPEEDTGDSHDMVDTVVYQLELQDTF